MRHLIYTLILASQTGDIGVATDGEMGDISYTAVGTLYREEWCTGKYRCLKNSRLAIAQYPDYFIVAMVNLRSFETACSNI